MVHSGYYSFLHGSHRTKLTNATQIRCYSHLLEGTDLSYGNSQAVSMAVLENNHLNKLQQLRSQVDQQPFSP